MLINGRTYVVAHGADSVTGLIDLIFVALEAVEMAAPLSVCGWSPKGGSTP